MRRHYRPLTLAERDARDERRIEALREAGEVPREPFKPRDPAYVSVVVDGQAFLAVGEPARKCRQFRWTLNGEPLCIGGLEAPWREIQRQRAPLLGTRNL